MQSYVIFLNSVIVLVMIIAFIDDKIDKKNRNEKRDKNMNSDTEQNIIGKKWVCLNEYQSILTQTLSSSGLR